MQTEKNPDKNSKKITIRYVIEREYLSRITVTELISRIIRSHAGEDRRKHGAGSMETMDNEVADG
ncbi:MAG: hypothetical protein IJ716_06505 [Lachnospiraceae bacterium]|nr:hypothetical protein [Lachnospiraceae bacterium]